MNHTQTHTNTNTHTHNTKLNTTYHQLLDSHRATFCNSVRAPRQDAVICTKSYPPEPAAAHLDRVSSRHGDRSANSQKALKYIKCEPNNRPFSLPPFLLLLLLFI